MARLIAIVANWWNVFCRLADPTAHRETITSRPAYMGIMGRIVESGRKRIHLGVPMFVDELDRSLHPLLVRAVLSLFQQRERNKNRAQLIFTTHCTDLLDDEILRLSEIGIVLKNIKLGTKVKRLCDFRKEGTDIRNVTNFRNRYLEGFYSGVQYLEL